MKPFKKTDAENPGVREPGVFYLGRKIGPINRRASDSALVAFVPLVRRLVVFPDLFEPANEARLGRFHKSSHGSLLYVLISSSIALEREAVCDRGHRASRLATMVKPVVAPKIIRANHSGIGSMPSGAGRL